MSNLRELIHRVCCCLMVVGPACSKDEYFDSEITTIDNTEEVSGAVDAIGINDTWKDRISGSADVHLVSLFGDGTYSGAWVYQFGDLKKDTNAYNKWPIGSHNMECGAASVQIIERLSGRSGVTCDFQKVVPGCESYPNVHTDCRAIGACGKFAKGVGYDDSSFDGLVVSQLATVLKSLGHDAIEYSKLNGHPVNLDIVKRAIDANNPVIIALSPAFYSHEVYPSKKDVDSHFVVIEGYGTSCKNRKFDSTSQATQGQGYIYLSDPGWDGGAFVCISEESFNKALEEEWNPSSYSGVEVIRAGSDTMCKATWYPPGSLLKLKEEYYMIVLPDEAGRMRYKHASLDSLRSNRIPIDRAIRVSGNVLSCAVSLGEMDSAVRFREYRDQKTGTIYLVDLVLRERRAFLNYEAYLSYDGREDWRSVSSDDVARWSSYGYAGAVGFAPGMLVKTNASSTVWVIERGVAQSIRRLPIANESAAKSLGYDLAQFGKNPRVSAVISSSDLDALMGPEGLLLTEERSMDCMARRCLAAIDCFNSVVSDVGGGEENLGNGACADCGMTSIGGSVSVGGSSLTGKLNGVQACVQSSRRCISDPSVYQVCIQDSYTGGTDWMSFSCPVGQSCSANIGTCAMNAVSSSGGVVSVSTSAVSITPTGGSSSVGSLSNGGTSLVSFGGAGSISGASSINAVSMGGVSGSASVLVSGGSSSAMTSASSVLHLHYEGPITGRYWIGGWWNALDGRTDVAWESSLLACEDRNIEDRIFDCELSMIPSGVQNFLFQVYLPDGRFWGDESCYSTGGCGTPIGVVVLTADSQTLSYGLKPNQSEAPYYNGWLNVVP